MLFLTKCPECGESRVPHPIAKWSDKIGAAIERFPLLRWIDSYTDIIGSRIRVRPEWHRRGKRICEALVRLGVMCRYTAARENESTRTIALYEGAAATNVTLSQYCIGEVTVCFSAEKNDGTGRHILFSVIPRPLGYPGEVVEWLDDKSILKQKLRAAKLPHASGGSARTFDEACTIFQAQGQRVVVKPHRGSRGRHTTLDIRSEDELRTACAIAFQVTDEVVVERYLKGTVHRVTLIGGKPVAVARREYPHVIGDGVHTVSELITIENKKSYRDGRFFKPLDPEYRVDMSLKKQSLTRLSVPARGQKVILSDKNSRLHGTLTEDVTQQTHPETMQLFAALGEVLGDSVVGVDFMCADITQSWKEDSDAGFLECNSMPFIDVHHRVISGDTVNVAAYLWDVVFLPQNTDSVPARYLL